MSDNNISRKDFLKVLGVGAAGALVMNSCKDRNDSRSPLVFSEDANMGEMTYRTNRHSKDKVSILGFGCMRFPTIPDPNSANNNIVDQEMVNKQVDYAMEHGINYFDTAPAYCRGTSEGVIGKALKRYQRDKFFIATKLSNFSPSTWSREASLNMYNNSFKNLQVEYIDYYLLHSVGNSSQDADGYNTFKKRYIDNGILDFLLEERKAGRIRNLGFSFHGDVRVFDELVGNNDKYQWDFVQIQMNYVDWKHAHDINPVNINAEYLYEELTKRDIPVVIMEPLLGGRLANLPDFLVAQLKQQKPENSVASWAFRFCGSYPNVLTVLSGMTYMEHLQDNTKTYSPLEPCSEKELALLEQIAETYLNYPIIPCTSCQYCMPCPYGINIPEIFVHYNKCVNEGNIPEKSRSENYDKARRAFLIGYDRSVEKFRQADHCIGCRQCESHCPQSIKISEQLHHIDHLVEQLRQNNIL